MFDPSKPAKIVVIGGSLSGLFATITLLHLPTAVNHSITILERNPTPLLHDQGAGIVAGSETIAWVERNLPGHGGGRRHEEIAVESGERLYLDLEGKVVDRETKTQWMTSWGLIYELCRDVVDRDGRGGQGGAKSTAVYRYGCNVQELRDLGDDGVEVLFLERNQKEEGKEEPDLGKERGQVKEQSIRADLVIVADGPSSHLRGMLLSNSNSITERNYAGYMAFRGTAPESTLSDAASEVFVQKFTFYHGHDPNTQILAYTIPGPGGSVEVGKRSVNWVWYWNIPEDSAEYQEVMTDSDGRKHRFTLPTGGKMQKHVWERQLDRARTFLPPQFSEIIEKTELPFAQAITDLEPPALDTKVGRLLNGKAVLVGDALAGFRPHTAASTSQAAYHSLSLEKVFLEHLSWEQYEKDVLTFAHHWQTRGVMLGERSQFGVHPLAGQQTHGEREVDRNELWMRK